jgi:hypothetical protein
MPAPPLRPIPTAPRTSPCPPSADTLTVQAARWADHVLGSDPGGLPPAYVARKALDAVAFSLRHGLRDLAIPTKLVGVKAHQHTVEALALETYPERGPGDRLPARRRPRLALAVGPRGALCVSAVRSDGSLQPVGRLQRKHTAWATPLVIDGPHSGLTVHLHAVTGLARRARGLPVTLGVNVRLSGFDHPLGVPPAPPRPGPALRAVAEPSRRHRQPAALAVRLWRDGEGVARMTCPHAVRHSPSGPEWGYRGSGPADCARSVLLALTDSATADAHYQAFEAEVVARVPEAGAVLQRDAVLAWLADRAPRAA